MYGKAYKLRDARVLKIIIELANYYCALPVVSHTLIGALLKGRIEVSDDVRSNFRHSCLYCGSQSTCYQSLMRQMRLPYFHFQINSAMPNFSESASLSLQAAVRPRIKTVQSSTFQKAFKRLSPRQPMASIDSCPSTNDAF
ncbi:uncharacterized protein LY89DRAFT_745316 [Mollisia scopiformis]|uniref:Uncharacterized protein n=1 Tax=Mollisia scopiformis TaxID=149040 RepID=A0A194XXC2_MOLSC|nr:uncharacterized protein LY89DRAFT_745316 [Mollisia scopiformis]KUJ24437.1 hypothetical protein LY89DRAFT_745316 [Mollisia scopiformis]